MLLNSKLISGSGYTQKRAFDAGPSSEISLEHNLINYHGMGLVGDMGSDAEPSSD